MGIILFTMVTGAMPYLKEASVEDPLYKLVVKNDSTSYWLLWHHIRSTPADSMQRQISMDLMAEQSMLVDLRNAVFGCLGSLYASVVLFLSCVWKCLLFILTCGKSGFVFEEEAKLPFGMYEYSDEFKDLVFMMMSYNLKQRPSLGQIRNHPWMLKGKHRRSPSENITADARLKQAVTLEMQKVKKALLLKSMDQAAAKNEHGEQTVSID